MRAARRDPPRGEVLRNRKDLREECREHLASFDVPGTPGVHFSRDARLMGLPMWAGERRILELSVTEGDPLHGEKRSDDHVGHVKVELPLGEVDDDTVARDVCECGSDRVLYEYSATHHIAGRESVYCPECETVHYQEEWS